MKYLIAASLLLVCRTASADDLLIPVPGENWSLKLEAPPLTRITEGVDTPLVARARALLDKKSATPR